MKEEFYLLLENMEGKFTGKNQNTEHKNKIIKSKKMMTILPKLLII